MVPRVFRAQGLRPQALRVIRSRGCFRDFGFSFAVLKTSGFKVTGFRVLGNEFQIDAPRPIHISEDPYKYEPRVKQCKGLPLSGGKLIP